MICVIKVSISINFHRNVQNKTFHFGANRMSSEMIWWGDFVLQRVKMDPRLIFYFCSIFLGSAAEPENQLFLQSLYRGRIQIHLKLYHFNLSLWFRGGNENSSGVYKCLSTTLNKSDRNTSVIVICLWINCIQKPGRNFMFRNRNYGIWLLINACETDLNELTWLWSMHRLALSMNGC